MDQGPNEALKIVFFNMALTLEWANLEGISFSVGSARKKVTKVTKNQKRINRIRTKNLHFR